MNGTGNSSTSSWLHSHHFSSSTDEAAPADEGAASILQQADQVLDASAAAEAAALIAAKVDCWAPTRFFMESLSSLEAAGGWPWCVCI